MDVQTIPDGYTPAENLLASRTVLVTGAGDGIGRAAAIAYARHGATVILTGRTVDKLESTYDAIEAAGGAQPAILPMDLATMGEEEAGQMAEAVGSTFDRLDGLLHNAGVLGQRRPIASASWQAWQEVMQVNVNSQFLLTRALLPLLEAADRASIIFTSSGVGRTGRAYWGAYAVSKFATEGLVQVLADELENVSDIRVNSLNPGPTNTRMRRTAYPGEVPTVNPSPEAIMPAYLYLMGDDSAPVTGASFDARP